MFKTPAGPNSSSPLMTRAEITRFIHGVISRFERVSSLMARALLFSLALCVFVAVVGCCPRSSSLLVAGCWWIDFHVPRPRSSSPPIINHQTEEEREERAQPTKAAGEATAANNNDFFFSPRKSEHLEVYFILFCFVFRPWRTTSTRKWRRQ